MKKIIYTLFLFVSATIFSQNITKANLPTNQLVVVNGKIATTSIFSLPEYKNNITSVTVYKAGAQLPQDLQGFQNLLANGFLNIKLKASADNFDKITFEELNIQNNLPKENPVMIDDIKFDNSKQTIIFNGMGNFEVITINGQKILQLSTTEKQQY